jgi:hypothetical protein
MKVQRDNLQNSRGNTTKIGKCFDGIGALSDQALYAQIANIEQIVSFR